MYACQNCEFKTDEQDDLERIAVVDLLDRVEPGEIMPYGECPKCGAFVHEATTMGISLNDREKLLLRMALSYMLSNLDDVIVTFTIEDGGEIVSVNGEEAANPQEEEINQLLLSLR